MTLLSQMSDMYPAYVHTCMQAYCLVKLRRNYQQFFSGTKRFSTQLQMILRYITSQKKHSQQERICFRAIHITQLQRWTSFEFFFVTSTEQTLRCEPPQLPYISPLRYQMPAGWRKVLRYRKLPPCFEITMWGQISRQGKQLRRVARSEIGRS